MLWFLLLTEVNKNLSLRDTRAFTKMEHAFADAQK